MNFKRYKNVEICVYTTHKKTGKVSYYKIKKKLDRKKDQLNNQNYFETIYKNKYFYWLREELRDMLHTAGAKLFMA